jgi:phage gp36-like protein
MTKEEIIELAKRAGSTHKQSLGVYQFYTDELEKFAELIVKECADIAKYHVMNVSTYADADFVYEQIKRYFGVEE